MRLASGHIGSRSLSVSNLVSFGFSSGESSMRFVVLPFPTDSVSLRCSLANANSSFLLDSSYLDPFQPHEFHLPFNPYATDAALSPDTIALFTPYVSSHSSWHGIEATASILKGSIERLGRLAAKWTESRAILTSSGRLAVSSSKVVPI